MLTPFECSMDDRRNVEIKSSARVMSTASKSEATDGMTSSKRCLVASSTSELSSLWLGWFLVNCENASLDKGLLNLRTYSGRRSYAKIKSENSRLEIDPSQRNMYLVKICLSLCRQRLFRRHQARKVAEIVLVADNVPFEVDGCREKL